MFAHKIESIEAQIEQLQQQQTKYQSLQGETLNALALINQIRQQALELGEADTVAIAFIEALQIQHTPPEPEVEPEPEQENPETVDDLEKYLDPEYLQQAINGDDVDLALMEIASLLDTSHELDLEERVAYFIQDLPSEMSDRLIGYLPKSIALLWAEGRDKVEALARESLFPPAQNVTPEPAPELPQIKVGSRVEVKGDGEKGTVSWLGQNSNGEPVASVTVAGGTRGSLPISKLNAEPENPPSDDELEVLARQCLGLRSWSQMRIFSDSNPEVIVRMQQIASTNSELRVMNNLPSLIIGYIQRANDRSDLEWLPEFVLSEVEALLTQPQVTAIA